MLVLTRKAGESITITADGKTLTISVVGVQRHQVKLGIEAPREVLVDRTEIAVLKQQQKQK